MVVGALPNAVPVIDTNMRRVLHRVFVGPDVPESAAKEPALLALAEKLVPPEGNAAWTWNQASWRSESAHLARIIHEFMTQSLPTRKMV